MGLEWASNAPALDSPGRLRQCARRVHPHPHRDPPMPPPAPTHGPFKDLIGYELTAWGQDTAAVALSVERHMNRSGVAHGGVVATLIDTACGFAGCYRAPPAAPRRALTLALHTQFIGPATAGARLVALAHRTGGGRQIFFSTCEVRDQDGRLVARGDGTFRYRSET